MTKKIGIRNNSQVELVPPLESAAANKMTLRLARVCAFVVIFWLAGSPSLVATENCPLNANRSSISLVRDVEAISQSRPKKMPTHLLRRKMMSLFFTLAERIDIFKLMNMTQSSTSNALQ